MTDTQQTAPGVSQRDQIAALVAAYEDAFNADDAEAMNALFSEDTIFVNFSGNLVFGAEPLFAAQAQVFAPGGPLRDVNVRYLVESIVFLTPEVAVVHARQRSVDADGRLRPRGQDPMEGVLQMTSTQDAQGRWRVRVAQNTPVTTPTAKAGT